MRSFVLLLVILALQFGSASAQAPASATPFAVVDVKKIVSASSATKDIQKQIEGYRKSVQAEIAKQEDDLQKEDKNLAEQRSSLSAQAFEDKRKAFKDKVTQVERNVTTRRTQLENAYTRAMSQVQDVMEAIISEIAAKKGFSVAIPASQILYYDKKLDISAEVLEELNKRLPSIKVSLEAKREEAPKSAN